MKRYQEKGIRLLFRADAAFAKPEVYEYLESRDTGYAMRLPANEVLQGNIRHLLKRPVGRPPKKPVVRYHDFVYQAQSWDIPRRVVAKVEWHQGELFPRVGFVVTNLNLPPAGVTHYYNGRGTAEQWIKEGKYALNWTRLSCHRFVANQVRLWLFVLAYNLGNFMRRLTLPESVKLRQGRTPNIRRATASSLQTGSCQLTHPLVARFANILLTSSLRLETLQANWRSKASPAKASDAGRTCP